MPRVRHEINESIERFYKSIMCLKTVEECSIYFGDLFTVQEIATFAQRLQVAGLLSEGCTYEQVKDEVKVSSSTITRINTELRYGSGGYKLVLDRLAENEKLEKAEE